MYRLVISGIIVSDLNLAAQEQISGDADTF